MFKSKWANLSLSILAYLVQTEMFEIKLEEFIKSFGGVELGTYDRIFPFYVVIVLLVFVNRRWLRKKLNLFWEKVWGKFGWETRKEKWERQRQEQLDKWEEERRKRQEARTSREVLIRKLIRNAEVVWRLLNRDQKEINYSELHEKCELITKTSLTKLEKYDFDLPNVLTVPIIGTDGPPRLSAENEEFYKNWRKFCLYIVPFIEGEEEEKVQNIWYEEFNKS